MLDVPLAIKCHRLLGVFGGQCEEIDRDTCMRAQGDVYTYMCLHGYMCARTHTHMRTSEFVLM